MKTVAILLGTLNGARFLPEQLASFDAQTFPNWTVHAADDGSSDATPELLHAFRARLGGDRIEITRGPGRGFVANFLQLACRGDVSADYFAFSDQDDVWQAQKLEKALQFLASVSDKQPAAYCSRTLLIDSAGDEIGYSPAFRRPPSFRNALVQSIAGGNTFVFNAALRRLLQQAGPDIRVPSHDWWVYLLTTACGGQVQYDLWPSVRYRIHDANEVGSNVGASNRIRRLRILLEGRFRRWTDENLAALDPLRSAMTSEAKQTLAKFERARQLPGPLSAWAMRGSGVYRQTAIGNFGLLLGAGIKRI